MWYIALPLGAAAIIAITIAFVRLVRQNDNLRATVGQLDAAYRAALTELRQRSTELQHARALLVADPFGDVAVEEGSRDA